MRRAFLLLTLCALAVALPRNTRSAESETEDSESQELSTTTTEKPKTNIIDIESSSDFETRVSQAGDKLVVVFAVTSWCSASKSAQPDVEVIAGNTKDLVVLKVDIENVKGTPGVAWKYGLDAVEKLPTFYFVKNRVLLEQQVASDLEELQEIVAKYLPGFSTTASNTSASDSDENV